MYLVIRDLRMVTCLQCKNNHHNATEVMSCYSEVSSPQKVVTEDFL